jgi:spermidine synthase
VPKHLLAARPDAVVDVVEIDPGITEAARRYFFLRDNPRLRVFNEDARVFLNRATARESKESYDIIMGDTFSSSYNIPFHLATKEAAGHIYSLLKKDGVFICNIISSITGDQGRIFRSMRAAFAQVFPQLHVFPVSSPKQGEEVQNIMLVALKTPRSIHLSWDASMRAMLDKEWTLPIPDDVPALTDMYAPVERYAMSVLRALGRL